MARTIPAPTNIVLPDPRKIVPTKTIFEGTAVEPGHWADAIVPLHNLGQAMMHAQPVFQQMFAADIYQFVFGGFTTMFEITLPKLSNRHNFLTFRIYGHSPAGAAGGFCKFTALTSLTTATVTLPAGPAPSWTAAATFLDVTLAFPVLDFETLRFEVDGDVDIVVIDLEWNELRPLGNYPALDDEMVVAQSIDNSWPLDTLEVAADRSVRSEFGETLFDTITDLSARVRVYTSFINFINQPPVVNNETDPHPYRVIVPVQDNGGGGHELRWRMQVVPDPGQETYHFIQFSGQATIADGRAVDIAGVGAFGFWRVTIPAAAAVAVWVSSEDVGQQRVRLIGADILAAPGAFQPGFAHLIVYPDLGLRSFTAWGT